MKHKILVSWFLFLSSTASLAIDGFYVGGALGTRFTFTEKSGVSHSTGLGFGLDLGIRTNPILDVMLQTHYSTHGNNATVLSETLSADFHIGEMNDFDLSIGAGPGFYFFKNNGVSETNFGFNTGANIDVIIAENARIGISSRYHGVFGSTRGGSFWSIMMRFGYFFSSGN